MKASLILLPLVLFTCLAASGQQPQPARPGAPRLMPGPGMGVPEEIDLSRNYRLTFTLKTSPEDSAQVSMLTASSRVNLSAVLAIDDTTGGTTIAEVSGTLAEKEDGRLRFSYHIGAQVPITSQSKTAPGPNPPTGPGRNIQYSPESVSGVLAVEPGKVYEVFKSGSRSYTVTISPESTEKQ